MKSLARGLTLSKTKNFLVKTTKFYISFDRVRPRKVVVARGSEKGMASLVVTMVLISLLSAMAVAFSLIMNRELQKSVNNQLGQSAYNAAASGINDAISFVRDNPNTNVTQCQDLIGTGKPLSAASNLSGDGSTKYTCVLINTKPPDLVYPAIPSYKSQVVRTSFSATVGKLMFSWQASNRAYNNFVPAAQSGQLFDETAWNIAKDAPMLKVSLYPIPADTKDASFALTNSRTYYLYPIRPTGFSVNTMSYATAAGTLQPVECGLKNNNGAFNGTADYDCNLIITNLPTANPAGYLYYVRMTPLYGTADVKIRANDASVASNEISFISTQAIIDVTAQSSSAVKRLQARVDISGLNGVSQDIAPNDNAFPEYALRAADVVCKRLQNPGSTDFPVYEDDASISYCVGLSKLKPPKVSVTCSDAGDYTSAKCSGTVDPNNGTVTECNLTVGSGSYNCQSLMPGSHSVGNVTIPQQSINAGGSGDKTYKLCARNAAGINCTADQTVSIQPSPGGGDGGGDGLGIQVITVSFTATNNWLATISDNGSGAGLAQCEYFAGGSPSSPGPQTGSSPISAVYGGHIMSYGSGTNPGTNTPGGTTLVHCSGVSGVCSDRSCGWSNVPIIPPASITINFFMTEGPYNNGNDRTGRFCPDFWLGGIFIGYLGENHQFMVCESWAITVTNDANPVYCTAHWAGPGLPPDKNTTNSGRILTTSNSITGGNGWRAGSNTLDDLYHIDTGIGGAGWLECRGEHNAHAKAVYDNPPTSHRSDYNYKTSYCRNDGARTARACYFPEAFYQ